MTDIVTANPDDYVRADGSVCFEATLHGLLIEACRAASTTQSPLVNDLRLDVFHELAASPPKPPTYADRMDVVATRRFPTESRINGRAVHFDIVEAKRDALSGHAQKYDRSVAQLMKYVDFVAMHHAGGNYAAISAFFVAHSFSDAVIRRYEESLREELGVVGRSYVLNPRDDPATRLWREMKLLKYSWSPVVGRLELHAVF